MDSNAALSQLQQIQSQSQDPNTILSNQQQQLGVNAAKDTVTGLRGAINNTTQLLKQVAPSVMGRTGNSLVTNAQATRQISNEQAPINQTLTDQGSQLTQDQQNLTDLQGQAQTAASGIYQGQQDKLSYAQNLYNTLYQKEQDAQAAAKAEADRQEQIREFNEQLAASKAASAASAGSSFNLTGAPKTSAAAAGNANQQQQAVNDVLSVLKNNNVGQLRKYYSAIASSAKNGNAYDQMKVAALNQYFKNNTPYSELIGKVFSLGTF